jgi:phosphoglycerate dehydrogenase-like enzyme
MITPRNQLLNVMVIILIFRKCYPEAMKFYFAFDSNESIKENCAEITGMTYSYDIDEADVVFFGPKAQIGKKTKILQRLYAGTDDLDLASFPPGITVLSNAGGYNEPVTETVFALLLSHYKQICRHNSDMHAGTYKKLGVETLFGKTIGIYGFGGIGMQVAKIASAMGMHISAFSRHRTPFPDVTWQDSLEKLAESTDILVICTPLSPETKGIINAPLLDRFMGQCIVNIARANIVDQDSMLSYLSRNKEKFYLTDVWWDEPNIKVTPPENCVVTPHIGGNGGEYRNEAFARAFRSVKSFLEGNRHNVVKSA